MDGSVRGPTYGLPNRLTEWRGKFLKKLLSNCQWESITAGNFKCYQLSWWHALVTVMSFNADIWSISPSSEQMVKTNWITDWLTEGQIYSKQRQSIENNEKENKPATNTANRSPVNH